MSTRRTEQPNRVESNASTEGITLLEGEHVLKNERPSWVNWWVVLTIGGVIALFGLVVLLSGDVVSALVVFAIAGLFYGYARIARKRSRIIVTNQRVKKSVGLARKSTGETRIAKIRGLSTEQGLVERLVGKGSILIDSGAASGKLGIRGVANHNELANTIREQQRRIEEAR
jgi:uncharacterized membrane protein YdbT with pleckstrin-like domain